MESARLRHWLYIISCVQMLLKLKLAEAGLVNITYLETAVAKGAVCLDGSPPAYHFDKGFGEGNNSWLINIEGGGWCNSIKNCISRKNSSLGSSKLMEKQLNFTGILSNVQQFNPDFYNWNKVKVRYCDGASFTADVEKVNPDTGLHFRGQRIFFAVIEHLLARGMENAHNVLLSGCSAGGLTTILHCDSFRTLLPMNSKVKCLSDAGYFINAKDISGKQRIQKLFSHVVKTHRSKNNLPRYCTSRTKPELNVAPQVVTPLFILNPSYDSWQIENTLAPDAADHHGLWRKCKLNLQNCSTDQLQTLHDFRLEFLSAIEGVAKSSSRGLFINSCYLHCQTELQEVWLFEGSSKLGNTPMAKAVGDWYYDRKLFQEIDCPYPCDQTCHNRIFDPLVYSLT